jgi:Mg2+-importing ATPase
MWEVLLTHVSESSHNRPADEAVTVIGLTDADAAQRLRLEGPNTIEERDRRSLLVILIGQFTSPLVILLVAASVVAIVVGDHVDAGIILVIVVLSATLGFVQEARSEGAVAALRARLALRATVVRNGEERDIPARELVRGDVVVLRAGDVVPADGRLHETNHLYVDESALTGESVPTLKVAMPGRDPTRSGDPQSSVFFGTSVVSGLGRVELTATGGRTAYGHIAHRLIERAPQNDFDRGVRRFGLLVSRVILLLVVGVFAADGLTWAWSWLIWGPDRR